MHLEIIDDKLSVRILFQGAERILAIDFLSKVMQARLHKAHKNNDLLKAIGLHRQPQLRVLDCCGGLGRDAAMMAVFGADVQMLERQPVLYALLNDALARANVAEVAWASRLAVCNIDAVAYLQSLEANAFDVIYIDPMYPKSTKSAAVKLELQLLRMLVGIDVDADTMLLHAFGKANKKIVVKRAKLAPFLANKKPSYSVKGASVRYDVYLS